MLLMVSCCFDGVTMRCGSSAKVVYGSRAPGLKNAGLQKVRIGAQYPQLFSWASFGQICKYDCSLNESHRQVHSYCTVRSWMGLKSLFFTGLKTMIIHCIRVLLLPRWCMQR